MAKRHLALAARPSVIIMAPKRRGRIRRAGRRVGHLARRGYHRAAPHLPLVGLGLGGLGVGYALQKGWLDKLPKLGGSTAITLAAAGFAAVKFGGRYKFLKLAGLAAIVAGAVDFGRVQGGGTSGLEDAGEETGAGESWGEDTMGEQAY